MTTQPTQRTKPTAQRAMDVYRKHGEMAMLAFLAVNIPDPEATPWLENEFNCAFGDRSIIARHDEGPERNHGLRTNAHYHLQWADRNGNDDGATIPSEINITEAPGVPPPPAPAIRRPTTRDIWRHVMAAIAADLGQDAPRGSQPALEIHETHLAAPSLLDNIHRKAVEHTPSPETEQALEEEARHLARKIVESLPGDERLELTRQILRRQRAPTA